METLELGGGEWRILEVSAVDLQEEVPIGRFLW